MPLPEQHLSHWRITTVERLSRRRALPFDPMQFWSSEPNKVMIHAAVTTFHAQCYQTLALKYFQQIGNAAGMGAKLALLSLKKRDEAQMIASTVRYIELASSRDFMQTFT